MYSYLYSELELHDYPMIVKHPMHLMRVQEKLKAREYRTVEEVLDHIQLIWDNCKAYNPEGHYFVMADKMERNFKKMIRNYLPNIQVTVPKPITTTPAPLPPPPPVQKPTLKPPPRAPNPPVIVPKEEVEAEAERESAGEEEIAQSEKNRFHQRLKQLTQQDLSSIIYLIQENCSEGYKDMGGGRGQILLDSIDPDTFRKLNAKLDELLDGDKILGTKKVKN